MNSNTHHMKHLALLLPAVCCIVLASCTSADLTEPIALRMRKNVKNLTAQEKADFVDAVKKLKTVESP